MRIKHYTLLLFTRSVFVHTLAVLVEGTETCWIDVIQLFDSSQFHSDTIRSYFREKVSFHHVSDNPVWYRGMLHDFSIHGVPGSIPGWVWTRLTRVVNERIWYVWKKWRGLGGKLRLAWDFWGLDKGLVGLVLVSLVWATTPLIHRSIMLAQLLSKCWGNLMQT